MKRYEVLFILNTSGREDSVGDIIDRLSKELEGLGCKIEKVQRMDRRSFARVAKKNYTSGYYLNMFARLLQTHFKMDDEVFRIMIGLAPDEKVGAEANETVAAEA